MCTVTVSLVILWRENQLVITYDLQNVDKSKKCLASYWLILSLSKITKFKKCEFRTNIYCDKANEQRILTNYNDNRLFQVKVKGYNSQIQSNTELFWQTAPSTGRLTPPHGEWYNHKVTLTYHPLICVLIVVKVEKFFWSCHSDVAIINRLCIKRRLPYGPHCAISAHCVNCVSHAWKKPTTVVLKTQRVCSLNNNVWNTVAIIVFIYSSLLKLYLCNISKIQLEW